MASLGIGLIGCGGFASRYHLPALLGMSGVVLRWICEIAPTRILKEFTRKAGVKLINEPSKMYSDDNCEAVVISIPHTLHYRYVLDAIRFGRHVLVDKPLTTVTGEAAELAREADRAELVGAVAFNRRFDPGCIRAREIIGSGGIGKLIYVTGFQFGYQTGWVLNPELGGGGVFWGRGIHLADLVPWLAGAKPIRVRGWVSKGPTDRVDYGGAIDVSFDGFENHIVCKEKGWRGWDELRLYGDRGMIELRRPPAREHGWAMNWECEGDSSIEHVPSQEAAGAATKDFVNAVTTGSTPACTFAAAAQSVALIESAFTSAAQGGSWIDLPK